MYLSEFEFSNHEKMFGLNQLIQLSKSKLLVRGRKAFDEMFYQNNWDNIQFKSDVEGSWKEDAWNFAVALMKNRNTGIKRQDRIDVCAMIFQECLEL